MKKGIFNSLASCCFHIWQNDFALLISIEYMWKLTCCVAASWRVRFSNIKLPRLKFNNQTNRPWALPKVYIVCYVCPSWTHGSEKYIKIQFNSFQCWMHCCCPLCVSMAMCSMPSSCLKSHSIEKKMRREEYIEIINYSSHIITHLCSFSFAVNKYVS